MKYIISCLFAVLNIFCAFSQIKGQILDEQNKPIPYANVLVQNSYIGTSANENGFYELPIKTEGTYTLIYKSIGFENFQKKVQISNFPITINVVLKEETNALEEMVITATKEDPAYYIIRNVLANKKKNQDKIQSYSVDFYSKGSFIVDTLPDKILFVDLKEEKKELDSIKTNYVYLSETFSELKYQKPNKYSENVWASKVSGNDNGFSLNTGLQSNLDFYNNNIKQLDQAISPFANNTFTYYTFKLVTTFLDDHNQLINKIKVSPKSNVTPTFSGYVYIVENSWEIYAIDLTILGKSVKKPFIESFAIQQNFEYNSNLQIWTKQSQAVTIKMGLFGAKLRGNFLYVFTNYNINPTFNLTDFSKTIVKFSDDSNKKDSIFWNTNRPIALTDTEKNDYKIKDSLQIVSKNKEDSLRLKNNTFKIRKLITGYTYQSPKKIHTFRYNGLLNQYGFNTVQGYFLGTQLSYVKKDTVAQKNIHLTAHVNYGFSEQRWRASGDFTKVIHAKTNTAYTISGGSAIVQYNNENPISNLVNSVASLAFNKNFAKFYNKDFVAIGFKTDLYDGIQVQSKLEYANRSALQNHSHVNIFNLNTEFTSNNPLLPNNDALAFTKNTLTKFTIGTQIRFGNKYIEKPNQKQVITNDKFPVLFLKYENAFTSSIKDYHFQNIKLNIKYTLNLNEYGKLNTNSTAFTFINQNKQLEFIDYQHFNGNQTYVYNNQLVNNQFFLLPYYGHSTQKAAVASHIAYNDKGFIINKIPLLKQTQWNIIANFNLLSTSHRNTYIEYAVGFDNLGFGKFRIFKLQYTQSNAVDKGFVFGINTNIF